MIGVTMKPKDSLAEQARKRREKQLRHQMKLLLKLEEYEKLHKIIKELPNGDKRVN